MTRGLCQLRSHIWSLLLIARWSEVYVRFRHDLQNLLLLGFLSALERPLELLDSHDLVIALVDLVMKLPVLRVVKVLDYEVDELGEIG